MADINQIPYGDWLLPAVPYNDSAFTGGNGNVWGVCTGLFPVLERGERLPKSFGASVQLGRHCVMAFDVSDSAGTTANGLWAELWTIANSDLAANALHASGQKLQEANSYGAEAATANDGVPDAATANAAAFMLAGKALMPHPGVRDVDGFVRYDQGTTTYTDETANVVSESEDTDVDITVLNAVDDALYIGYAQTFQGVVLKISFLNGTTASATYVHEYWDGSAWQSLTTAITGVTDAKQTAAVSGTLLPQYLYTEWTVPNDWIQHNASGSLPSTLNWMRIRMTVASTQFNFRVQLAWAVLGRSVGGTAFDTHLAPAVYDVSDDPNTRTPDLISWGMDNWWNPAANFKGNTGTTTNFVDPLGVLPSAVAASFDRYVACYYDSSRRHESATVGPLATPASGSGDDGWIFNPIASAQANADMIRIYIRLTTTKKWYLAYLGTQDSGDDDTPRTTELAVTNATLYVIGVHNEPGWTDAQMDEHFGAGPHYAQDGNENNFGTPITTCLHRNRMYAGGANIKDNRDDFPLGSRVLYSARNKYHQFPAGNFFDVNPGDGQPITAVRSLRDVVVICKTRSIYLMIGEPSPVAATFQVKKVADVGCVATQTAVVMGNRMAFLSEEGLMQIDASGQVSPLPESEPLKPLFESLTATALGSACAAYDPAKKTYLCAVPGLQAQFSKGASTGQTVNDGVVAWHIPTGQWAAYGGIYAASMATVPASDRTHEIWIGDYHGRVWRMTSDTQEGQSAAQFSGTATAGGNTTLTDTNTTFLASATDRRVEGQWVWIISGTGAGQVRKVIGTTANVLTVSPAWTTNPSTDSAYRIGPWYAAVEFGDWDFGTPDTHKSMQSIIIHLEKAMNSSNDMDVAVNENDVEQGTAFSYATGSVGTTNPTKLTLPAKVGYTQRARIHMKLQAERPRIRAITVDINDRGSPLRG